MKQLNQSSLTPLILTSAMRLGLAKGPVTEEDIIYFA